MNSRDSKDHKNQLKKQIDDIKEQITDLNSKISLAHSQGLCDKMAIKKQMPDRNTLLLKHMAFEEKMYHYFYFYDFLPTSIVLRQLYFYKEPTRSEIMSFMNEYNEYGQKILAAKADIAEKISKVEENTQRTISIYHTKLNELIFKKNRLEQALAVLEVYSPTFFQSNSPKKKPDTAGQDETLVLPSVSESVRPSV